MRTIPIPPGLETRCFVLEENALAAVPEVLRREFPGRRPWLVADGNTFRAAGEALQKILCAAGLAPHAPFLYPGTPVLHADYANITPLSAALPADAVPVAVGGGTVNDLVKRAAGEAQTAYCCIPTAPSVDGYSSSGAALTFRGLKQTMKCPAPRAIVADVAVLRHAPPAMAAAGYADLFAKVPAGAEWLIAETLGIEAVRGDVWDLVQKKLRRWLRDPADLDGVFEGLAATGYAMQMYGDSRPASGMEHLASHVWEMEGVEASHGFKVGLGTLASTFLLEQFFALSRAELQSMMTEPKSRAARECEVDRLLAKGVYGNAKAIAMAKFLDGDALRKRRQTVLDAWDTLQAKVRGQIIPFRETLAMLRRAGCPTAPAEIGLSDAAFLHGLHTAQLIRKRYTLLDLMEELGVLPAMLEKLKKEFPRG